MYGHPHAQPTPSEILSLGETTWRRQHQRFGLLQADRLRHLWLLGKTGAGKSTLLANCIAQDLEAGRGLALLDPHGDLVREVLSQIPRSRINETLLFAPADKDWPFSFNVFRQGRRAHPDQALLASQLVSVFKKHWSDSWGPRLEHILRNALLAVSADPHATLVLLYRFLFDESLRARVLERVDDPVVSRFWSVEFPGYGKRLAGEALSPVLNKLGAFLTPAVRNIVGQERSRLDLIELMAERGVLLADLATGNIGEDASRLLGSLLLTQIQLAAMERPRGGPPFIVYADEFQYFATDSIATVLSESRKFGLGLVLAHQYLAQLPEHLRDAVLGNIGSMIVFRIGAADALALEAEFSPPFFAKDLETQPRYHFAAKLTVRGMQLAPFSGRSLTPRERTTEGEKIARDIREQSRARFALPRERVEAQIRAQLES